MTIPCQVHGFISVSILLIVVVCAVPVHASQADDLISDGNAYYSQGMYQEAIGCFERAIDLDPSNAAAWYNKGFLSINLVELMKLSPRMRLQLAWILAIQIIGITKEMLSTARVS
jgi:tetratricopeptide (TPR) repeat protein